MSFSSNPFSHLELALSVGEDGQTYLHWHCESCGGGWREAFGLSVPIVKLIEEWHLHLMGNSHKLRPTHVVGWYCEYDTYKEWFDMYAASHPELSVVIPPQ